MTKRAKKAAAPVPEKLTYIQRRRMDGFTNYLTGLGTNRDKNNATCPTAENIDTITLENYYRGSDMAARIVDTLPNEMTRNGWCFRSENDPELNKFVDGEFERLEINRVMNRALKLSRLYGTAYVLLGVNDGEADLSVPLDWSKVRSIDFLNTFDMREVRAMTWYVNPIEEKFGWPLMYQLVPRGMNIAEMENDSKDPFALAEKNETEHGPIFYIHESRFIRFDGTEFLRGIIKDRKDTADSVLARCWQIIDYYATAWGSTAALLADFAQGILKLKGVAEALGADKENLILDRLAQIDMTRASGRLMALDADAEDFLRRETPIGGLSDLLQQFALRMAACAQMPAALLMGQSPAGLNSTGAAELRWFYDNVTAMQKIMLLPPLKQLAMAVMQSAGKSSPNWNIKFEEMMTMTAKEKADVHQQMAQADSQYIANGVLSADETALSRFGGDEYGVETHININSRGGLDTLQAEDDDLKTTQNVTYFDKIVLLSTNVAGGLMTRESAKAIMVQFFGMDDAEAEALLGPKVEPNPGTPTGGPDLPPPGTVRPTQPTKGGNPAQPGKPKGLADKKKAV